MKIKEMIFITTIANIQDVMMVIVNIMSQTVQKSKHISW